MVLFSKLGYVVCKPAFLPFSYAQTFVEHENSQLRLILVYTRINVYEQKQNIMELVWQIIDDFCHFQNKIAKWFFFLNLKVVHILVPRRLFGYKFLIIRCSSYLLCKSSNIIVWTSPLLLPNSQYCDLTASQIIQLST